MKKVCIIFAIVIVFVIVAFMSIDHKEKDKIEYKVSSKILDKQKDIDILINEYSNSDKYTFENPKIIVNPYDTINTSSLIIFNTRKETSIKIVINGKDVGKTAKEKKHIIAIMNLKSNYDNKVKLITDDLASNELVVNIPDNDLLNNEFKLLGAIDNNYLLVNDKYNNKYKIDYLGRVIEYYGLNDSIGYNDKYFKSSFYNNISFDDIKKSCDGFSVDEVISTNDIKDELEKASLTKDYNIDGLNFIIYYPGKDIKVLLVDGDKTYVLPYDKSAYLGFLDKKYELYTIIDGKYYNLDLIVY